jgi:hypothetical protein
VTSNRLLSHIEKAWADGLFISSVAACGDNWTLVLDAASAYSVQIFKVCPSSFLPKVRQGPTGARQPEWPAAPPPAPVVLHPSPLQA